MSQRVPLLIKRYNITQASCIAIQILQDFSLCLYVPTVFTWALFLKLSWLLRFKICYYDGVSTASAWS